MGLVYFPTFFHEKKMKLTIHEGKNTVHWVCWHSFGFFAILTRHSVHDTSKNTLKTGRFWHPMTFQQFLGSGVFYLPGSSWANVDLPFAAANGWLGAKKEQALWLTWILFVYSDTVNASVNPGFEVYPLIPSFTVFFIHPNDELALGFVSHQQFSPARGDNPQYTTGILFGFWRPGFTMLHLHFGRICLFHLFQTP